jgi:hypothetical protein
MTGSNFRVTLLGTGVPIPSPDRFGPCTLVEAGGQKFAAHELGQVHVKHWSRQLTGDTNGLKGYFKFLAGLCRWSRGRAPP